MKKLIIILVILGLLAGAYFAQPSLLGKKPTQTFKPKEKIPLQVTSPQLDKSRGLIKENPKDFKSWKKLARQLEVAFLKSGEDKLLLELIQVLAEMIKLEPNDIYAYQKMADISFEKQVFDRASEYYKKALELDPKDDSIRIKYSSSLIFQGQPDLALAELKTILEKQPNSFQALAFKAIALAEKGEKEEAQKIGELALKFAPNAEAQNRFQQFLQGLNKPTSGTQDSLENFVKNHPILGPKLVSISTSDGAGIIVLKDFPVEQMPEMAKVSLKEKLAKYLDSEKLSKIVLVDKESNMELLKYEK